MSLLPQISAYVPMHAVTRVGVTHDRILASSQEIWHSFLALGSTHLGIMLLCADGAELKVQM